MNQGQTVKFRNPVDAVEIHERMVVIENRGPRILVASWSHLDKARWPITPMSVYPTDDLEVVEET